MVVTDDRLGAPQEPADDEEGRMTLFEHLAELRSG